MVIPSINSPTVRPRRRESSHNVPSDGIVVPLSSADT
jgi:hypothetical protein